MLSNLIGAASRTLRLLRYPPEGEGAFKNRFLCLSILINKKAQQYKACQVNYVEPMKRQFVSES
jgi:hypothetical protein